MPIDPSLSTISTSVRVPQLALVTQQVGLSFNVNTHCLHLCRVETFLFSALDVYYPRFELFMAQSSVVLSPQWPPAC